MFYNNFLEKLGNWAMGIPLQSFWVVVITFPTEVKYWLEKQQNSQLDYAGWNNFATNAYEDIISSTYNDESGDEYVFGCLFARTINIPGEKLDYSNSANIPAGGGLMFPAITTQRNSPATLDISFLETNSSFVDVGIRPWCIASSYAGLVARKQGNVKGTIRAIFYAKSDLIQDTPAVSNSSAQTPRASYRTITDEQYAAAGDISSSYKIVRDPDPDAEYTQQPENTTPTSDSTSSLPGPKLQNKKLSKRKIFTFNDVIPITVNNQEYSYLGDAVLSRQVQFLYSSYTIDTGDTGSLVSDFSEADDTNNMEMGEGEYFDFSEIYKKYPPADLLNQENRQLPDFLKPNSKLSLKKLLEKNLMSDPSFKPPAVLPVEPIPKVLPVPRPDPGMPMLYKTEQAADLAQQNQQRISQLSYMSQIKAQEGEFQYKMMIEQPIPPPQLQRFDNLPQPFPRAPLPPRDPIPLPAKIQDSRTPNSSPSMANFRREATEWTRELWTSGMPFKDIIKVYPDLPGP